MSGWLNLSNILLLLHILYNYSVQFCIFLCKIVWPLI